MSHGPDPVPAASKCSVAYFKQEASAKWKSFGETRVYKVMTSDKMLIAMSVVGLLGLLAAAAGTAGIASQAGVIHGQVAHALNSLGNYAIGMAAAGGALTILGGICLGILINRVLERRKAEKQKHETEENSAERFEGRMNSIQDLPEVYRPFAHKLPVGQYKIFEVNSGSMFKANTFSILVASHGRYLLDSGLNQKQLDNQKRLLDASDYKQQK
jgi:hypothetical protein